MSKPKYMTGYLIRRYRKERGWIIKRKPDRGTSLSDRIHEIFGDKALESLTDSALKNIETQNEAHHREPTPQELYQIARALEVPIMALIVDAKDPFAVCPFSPKQETNCEIAFDEIHAMKDFEYLQEADSLQFSIKMLKMNCISPMYYGFFNVKNEDLTTEQINIVKGKTSTEFENLTLKMYLLQSNGIQIPESFIREMQNAAKLIEQTYGIRNLKMPKIVSASKLADNRKFHVTGERELNQRSREQVALMRAAQYNPALLDSLIDKDWPPTIEDDQLEDAEEVDW
ncbi:helix-turn-helix domain-containing protein [Bifidobacterium simiarum]|uniref:Uncharacterized protein n=1 Tax=Bifidobacterium simiarum TaxID=2045441 RepID=A0A2M9HEX8_9BIFI|nr:hypothetical protein [Bifidobacterium simiarum]PJM75363.1 hypothetical protein CSQ87_04940 [Bifidobacterium simiarum]